MLIPLLGVFKGETGVQNHLRAIINETVSKLKVRWFLELLKTSWFGKYRIMGLYVVIRTKN